MELPFHYVDLRTFCYETEVESRVEDALQTFLPEDTTLERAVNEGHNGDEIVVLSVRLERADDVRHVFSALTAGLDFEAIRMELTERVDENCALYLSLDKQAAARGEVELGDGITLRTKVEAYPARKTAAIENAEDAFIDLASS